jgi:hypothetical protein
MLVIHNKLKQNLAGLVQILALINSVLEIIKILTVLRYRMYVNTVIRARLIIYKKNGTIHFKTVTLASKIVTLVNKY